jgi:hypothetical protein
MSFLGMDICPSLNDIMEIRCNTCTRSEQGYDFKPAELHALWIIDQFHVTAAIMVQRSIGVEKPKQDVIAFVNTVTQLIHRGSYAHIVTVVRKFS